LSCGSHPPDFPDREKNDEHTESEEKREENRQIYERELPGKGGQLEPRHYNDWLAEANSPSAIAAPANSPLSLCVFVCR